jgi:hypothetical protein
MLTTVPERGVTQEVVWPMNDISDPRALASLSAKASGVNITAVVAKRVYEMMTAFTTTLKDRKQHRQAYSELGWTRDKQAFVTGDAVVTATGVMPIATSETNAGFGILGDEKRFNLISNSVMANETRPEAHALIAAAFAGPLFGMTGSDGVLLNFYSGRSGFGKSTLVKLGAAAWGARSALVANADDTTNALFQRLTVLRNITQFLDELRVADPAKYMNLLLYRLMAGMEKRRLNSAAQAQESKEWKTIMVSATNFSIASILDTATNAGDAAASRFLDFNLPPLPAGSSGRAMQLMSSLIALEDNYGFAGRHFMEVVVPTYDAVSAQVQLYKDKLMPHTITTAADTSGRFQSAAGACLLVAASILEKNGIMPVNTGLVAKAVVSALKIGKGDRELAQTQVGYVDILREFFKIKEGNRLMLRNVVQGTKQTQMMRSDHPFVARPVAYEVNITAKEVVIDWRALHAFMIERGHNASEVFREVDKVYPHEIRPLGVNTAYATTARKVVAIKLGNTAWDGLANS